MVIKQHYYTSTQQGLVPGRTGFQVKAQSDGIPQSILESLGKFIGYRTPTSLESTETDQHPVSLRYYCFDTKTALLTCTQSAGTDELGRPGNFFAHSLIANLDAFIDPLLPIDYWQAAFWVKQDDSQNTLLPDLDALDTIQPSAQRDKIWDFLAEGSRREWFKALLGAAIDYDRPPRRIIIVDSTENVVLWMTALCAAMPHRYARYISFATYYHDPIRSPFLISGTTPDSVNFMPDDFNTYFIIDAYAQKASSSPQSDYVDAVMMHFQRDRLDIGLRPFLNNIATRAPGMIHLNAQSAIFTHFWQVQTQLLAISDPKALVAARAVLADIVTHELSDTSADLRVIIDVLTEHLRWGSVASIVESYRQALERLHPQDPNPQTTLSAASYILILLVRDKQSQLARAFLEQLNKLYGKSAIRQSINEDKYLTTLADRLEPGDLDQQLMAWSLFGQYFDFAAESPILTAILHRTFQTIAQQTSPANGQPSPAFERLSPYLYPILRQHADFMLTQAAVFASQNENDSRLLKWLYYEWVKAAHVSQRKEHYWDYWSKFSKIAPDLYLFEMEQDFKRINGTKEAVELAFAWGESVEPDDKIMIFENAVVFAQGLPTVDAAQFARLLLINEQTGRLLRPRLTQELIAATLPGITFLEKNPETIRLYENILNAKVPVELSNQQEAVLKGAVALFHKQIADDDVAVLEDYFARADEKICRIEMPELINAFFFAQDHPKTHHLMLHIAYHNTHRAIFWEHYWPRLQHLFMGEKNIRAAAAILDVWFTHSVPLAKKDQYMLHDFALQLPGFLSELAEHRDYKKIATELQEIMRKQSWYTIIEPHLPEGRKRRFGII